MRQFSQERVQHNRPFSGVAASTTSVDEVARMGLVDLPPRISLQRLPLSVGGSNAPETSALRTRNKATNELLGACAHSERWDKGIRYRDLEAILGDQRRCRKHAAASHVCS